jgi:glutathione S-transferase
MKLHDYVLSPNCYKVRLMASLAGISLETVAVDFYPGRAHKVPEFLALNPAGTLPVLEDGALVLAETQAILVHLALEGDARWLGDDPVRLQAWLAFSARLNHSLGVARAHDMLLAPADIDAVRAAGVVCLRQIEAALVEGHLLGEGFLAGPRPTIADIACFPHVALAPDGGVRLDAYPRIRLWMRALRGLPGFIEMPGIHRLHELSPDPHPAPEPAA